MYKPTDFDKINSHYKNVFYALYCIPNSLNHAFLRIYLNRIPCRNSACILYKNYVQLFLMWKEYPSVNILFWFRYYILIWWTIWGGFHSQPERHQQLSWPQALGINLLLRASLTGFGPQGLAGQERECEGSPGTTPCQGKGRDLWWPRSCIKYIHKSFILHDV